MDFCHVYGPSMFPLYTRIQCMSFSNQTAWLITHDFFHFFPPHSLLLRTKSETECVVTITISKVTFVFVISFSLQRSRDEITVKMGKPALNGITWQLGYFISCQTDPPQRLVINFSTTSYLRSLLSQNPHSSQKSRIDRQFYKSHGMSPSWNFLPPRPSEPQGEPLEM